MFHDVGVGVTRARVPAPDRAPRGRRGEQGRRALVHQARHHGHDQRPLRRRLGHGRRRRRARDGRPGGQGARRAARRADARRHRPGRQHRGHRPRDDARSRSTAASSRSTATCARREPHVYAIGDIVGGLWLAHTAGHEGIIAAHVIAGEADVHPMDYDDPAAGHLLPAGDRLHRPDRGAGQGRAGRTYKVGKVPFQAIAKAIIGGEYEGFAKVIADARPTTRWASTSSARTRPTSSPRRRSASCSTRRRGRSAARPTRTRRCRRSSARRPWPSTAGRSTSSTDPAAAPGGPTERWPRPAARRRIRACRLGRPDRRRPRRDVPLRRARARRRRADVDPQPGRPDPVRHLAARATRAPRSGSPGRSSKGHDWIAPFYRSIATCLTFGMSARDIMTAQYATANDPSSGGRQMPGHYGSHEHNIVSRLVAGRDPAAACRRDRPRGQDPQDRPGRDDHAWARGSSNQGDVHEGLNFAAIHKLPFVFVVENNGYAISVPAARQVSVAGRRRPGGGLRHARRRRRRRRRAGLLRRGARRGRPGAGRARARRSSRPRSPA